MNGDDLRRWVPHPVLACLLLFGIGAAVYVNSLPNPFVFDDLDAIVRNEHIRRFWPPDWVLAAPKDSPFQARPVVNFTIGLNYAMGGLNVGGYRTFNLLIHIFCAMSLFGIIRRTLRGEMLAPRFGRIAESIAFVSALLWMIHPLHTEVINYISQRTQSMMGLFYLLTLYCAIRAAGSKRRMLWDTAAIFSCAFGMACKESMVTAPLMVLVYDLIFGSGPLRKRLKRRQGLYCGLAATWIVLAVLAVNFPLSNVGFDMQITPLEYAYNQCVIIVDYLRLAFWPDDLLIDYGFARKLTAAEVWPFGIIVLGLLSSTLVLFLVNPRIAFFGAWFFILLGPTSSFLVMPSEVGAERRMYLPLSAISTAVVIFGCELLRRAAARRPERAGLMESPSRWRRRHLLTALLVVLVASTLAWTTVRRNRLFSDEEALWRDAIRINPNNARAYYCLGNQMAKKGLIEETMAYFEKALELKPDYFAIHQNLGNLLLEQGFTEEAMRHFNLAARDSYQGANAHFTLAELLRSKGDFEGAISQYLNALRMDPRMAHAHNNLGSIYSQMGAWDKAVERFTEAIEINPEYSLAHYNLGNIYQHMGKLNLAAQCFEKAILLKSDYAKAICGLGKILAVKGQREDAIRQYRLALEADSDLAEAHLNLGAALALDGKPNKAFDHLRQAEENSPDLPDALNGMARILCEHPNASLGDPADAVRFAERAVELTERRNPLFLDTLSAAYAASGRRDRAVKTLEEALKRAEEQKDGNLVKILRRNLNALRR